MTGEGGWRVGRTFNTSITELHWTLLAIVLSAVSYLCTEPAVCVVLLLLFSIASCAPS